MAIESADYEETRKRLEADPIVKGMAHGVEHMSIGDIAHQDENGNWVPRFEFMQAANAEYRSRLDEAGRADDQPRHIGGVAEAIIRILKGLIW